MLKSFKYQGIMKGFDLSKITQKLIDELLDKGVYVKTDMEFSFSKSDLFWHERLGSKGDMSDEDEKEHEMYQGLCGKIHFRGNFYSIKKEVIDEIYSIIKYYCSLYDNAYQCRRIEKKASLCLKDSERISLFEEEYKLALLLIDNEVGYSKFLENQDEWKSYVYKDLMDDNILIEEHLSDKILSFGSVSENDYSIIKEWMTFERVKEITICCRQNLDLLLNKETKTENKSVFTRSQKIHLFEELMSLHTGVWDLLSATRKGEILEVLIDRSRDNIKKDYLSFNNPPTKKINSDQKLVGDFLRSKINPLG